MRNGVVAKAFQDAGAPYKRIFGLQIPQIGAIAREAGYDFALGRELLLETDCREARLLAYYLFDPVKVTEAEAIGMAQDVKTREEADILAWRLLRRLPYAASLTSKIEGYVAEALDRNLNN